MIAVVNSWLIEAVYLGCPPQLIKTCLLNSFFWHLRCTPGPLKPIIIRDHGTPIHDKPPSSTTPIGSGLLIHTPTFPSLPLRSSYRPRYAILLYVLTWIFFKHLDTSSNDFKCSFQNTLKVNSVQSTLLEWLGVAAGAVAYWRAWGDRDEDTHVGAISFFRNC